VSLKTASLVAIVGLIIGFVIGRILMFSQNALFDGLQKSGMNFESIRVLLNLLWIIPDLIRDGCLVFFFLVLYSKQKQG
jgi:hypothetical protein